MNRSKWLEVKEPEAFFLKWVKMVVVSIPLTVWNIVDPWLPAIEAAFFVCLPFMVVIGAFMFLFNRKKLYNSLKRCIMWLRKDKSMKISWESIRKHLVRPSLMVAIFTAVVLGGVVAANMVNHAQGQSGIAPQNSDVTVSPSPSPSDSATPTPTPSVSPDPTATPSSSTPSVIEPSGETTPTENNGLTPQDSASPTPSPTTSPTLNYNNSVMIGDPTPSPSPTPTPIQN